MPDYQLGKIYQIVCLTTGQKYIGSTTEPTLARRLSGHVRTYKCWKKEKHNYISSFTIIEGGNFQIELLETCPCNSKDELNAREGHYIRTIDCVNRCVTGRSLKESYKAYRETHKTEIKAYYEANKDRLAAYKREYRKKKSMII